MAGLDPAIHVLARIECRKNVDARHKAGHDKTTSAVLAGTGTTA